MTSTKMNLKGKSVMAMLAVVASILGSSLAASPASASKFDPHVHLQGTVSCGLMFGAKVTGLWLWSAEDGGIWIPFSGANHRESYSRDFTHVPSGGTIVYYDIYCDGGKAMHRGFKMGRPFFGSVKSRSLYVSI